MKNKKSWITLVEVMVALFILSLSLYWIFSTHRFIMAEERIIKEQIYMDNFDSYLYDLFLKMPLPSYSVWTKFYIVENSDWNFIYTNTSSSSEDKIWFFDDDFPLDFSHEIEYVSNLSLNWNDYHSYRINIKLWELEKTYMVAK